MLILGRRRRERIFIGEQIVIEVTELRGDRVWLGITAPGDVRIDREEVRRAIRARGDGPAMGPETRPPGPQGTEAAEGVAPGDAST